MGSGRRLRLTQYPARHAKKIPRMIDASSSIISRIGITLCCGALTGLQDSDPVKVLQCEIGQLRGRVSTEARSHAPPKSTPQEPLADLTGAATFRHANESRCAFSSDGGIDRGGVLHVAGGRGHAVEIYLEPAHGGAGGGDDSWAFVHFVLHRAGAGDDCGEV